MSAKKKQIQIFFSHFHHLVFYTGLCCFCRVFFIRSNHCQIRRSNNHHYKLTCHHWKSHGNETGGLKITTQYVVRRTFGVGLLRCSVHLFNWVPNVVLNFKIAILNLLSDKTEKYIEWTHHFTIQTQVISIWHEIQTNFQFEKSVLYECHNVSLF